MDKHIKRLVERLLNEYESRSLNENIFQKLLATYGNKPQQKNMGKIYQDAMDGYVQPLTTANDRQDIINYFIDTFKFNSIFRDMVEMTIGYINGRQGNIEYKINRWTKKEAYPDLAEFLSDELSNMYKDLKNISIVYNDDRVRFNCKIAGIVILFDILLEGINSLGELIPGVNCKLLRFSVNNVNLGNLICGYTKDDPSVKISKPKIAKSIAEYNANLDLFGSKFDLFLNGIVVNKFNVDRLEEELFCDEKVYKMLIEGGYVKDIKRQANIFNLRGAALLNGLDAITEPRKMCARLAATFIVADFIGMHEMELKVDDNTLIRLFYKDNVTDKSINCEALLSRLRRPMKGNVHIHLKDVIATYLHYKDDPKVLETCRRYC